MRAKLTEPIRRATGLGGSIEGRRMAFWGGAHVLAVALLIAILYFFPGDLSLGQRVALAIILSIPAFILASIIKDLAKRD
ncbi:MAG: hypothetical protein QXK34_00990 [Candidatus Bathyarchaeia archaeon]